MTRLLFLLAFLGACAPSLKPDDDGTVVPPGDGHIVTNDNGDGTFTTTVDSSDEASFVYFDFESHDEVAVDKPLNSIKWDVGFKRYLIPSNGGISGPGGVMIAALEGGDFGAIDKAPATGFLTDAEDPAEDGDEDPDYVFNAIPTVWYAYDPDNHTLSPANRVYVLRSVEGKHYKIRFLDYYDDAGNAGHVRFQWAEVGPPSTEDSFAVDANDPDAWVYLSFAKGGVVAIGDPQTSDEWDLALQRTVIQTNSGTSGMALGGARLSTSTYEETTSSPTIGFSVDTMIPAPGPPGSGEVSGHLLMNTWYDYDELSHKVTTKGETYLVRTALGDYGKFQILYYAEGVYELRLAPVTRNVTVESATVDASQGVSYFSLRLGEAVDPVNPADDASWDIALDLTKVQTNSGTSGSGMGGALDPMEASLAAITSAPASGYLVDAMITVGPETFSGNPVLSDWFETSTTNPKDQAYLVRTADQGYVKLKVASYATGSYTFDWAYSGPGRTDF